MPNDNEIRDFLQEVVDLFADASLTGSIESKLRNRARALLSTHPTEQAGAGQPEPRTDAREGLTPEQIDRYWQRYKYGRRPKDVTHKEVFARILREVALPEPRAEVTDDKQDMAKGLIKTLSDIIHDQTVAMQSAIIEWQHGNGAEAGLSWIVNTLEGPGHLPDFDAPHGKHAQFWFNANQANPLPACFCGNPSSSLWMGQGFCCDDHYREAKAKHDDARSGGAAC